MSTTGKMFCITILGAAFLSAGCGKDRQQGTPQDPGAGNSARADGDQQGVPSRPAPGGQPEGNGDQAGGTPELNERRTFSAQVDGIQVAGEVRDDGTITVFSVQGVPVLDLKAVTLSPHSAYLSDGFKNCGDLKRKAVQPNSASVQKLSFAAGTFSLSWPAALSRGIVEAARNVFPKAAISGSWGLDDSLKWTVSSLGASGNVAGDSIRNLMLLLAAAGRGQPAQVGLSNRELCDFAGDSLRIDLNGVSFSLNLGSVFDPGVPGAKHRLAPPSFREEFDPIIIAPMSDPVGTGYQTLRPTSPVGAASCVDLEPATTQAGALVPRALPGSVQLRHITNGRELAAFFELSPLEILSDLNGSDFETQNSWFFKSFDPHPSSTHIGVRAVVPYEMLTASQPQWTAETQQILKKVTGPEGFARTLAFRCGDAFVSAYRMGVEVNILIQLDHNFPLERLALGDDNPLDLLFWLRASPHVESVVIQERGPGVLKFPELINSAAALAAKSSFVSSFTPGGNLVVLGKSTMGYETVLPVIQPVPRHTFERQMAYSKRVFERYLDLRDLELRIEAVERDRDSYEGDAGFDARARGVLSLLSAEMSQILQETRSCLKPGATCQEVEPTPESEIAIEFPKQKKNP